VKSRSCHSYWLISTVLPWRSQRGSANTGPRATVATFKFSHCPQSPPSAAAACAAGAEMTKDKMRHFQPRKTKPSIIAPTDSYLLLVRGRGSGHLKPIKKRKGQRGQVREAKVPLQLVISTASDDFDSINNFRTTVNQAVVLLTLCSVKRNLFCEHKGVRPSKPLFWLASTSENATSTLADMT
jgi:hypothetical protein